MNEKQTKIVTIVLIVLLLGSAVGVFLVQFLQSRWALYNQPCPPFDPEDYYFEIYPETNRLGNKTMYIARMYLETDVHGLEKGCEKECLPQDIMKKSKIGVMTQCEEWTNITDAIMACANLIPEELKDTDIYIFKGDWTIYTIEQYKKGELLV